MLLAAVLAFAYGGVCIYAAKRDIALAQNERTATGQAFLHPQSKDPNIFDSLRCDYQFTANDRPYSGHGICPRQTDHSAKGALQNLAGLLQNQSVTVYYDPADPTTNSMIEFGAKRDYDYKKAKLSFVAGSAILIFLAIAALYLSGGDNSSQGVAADPQPQEFAAHPGHIGPEEHETDPSANN
jgi:hypothetical protein